MNWSERTLKTYNTSADKLAAYFEGIGPRIADIERGLELGGASKDSRVVEIGCGDGRDAVEIAKRAGWFEGVDPSCALLTIARNRLTNASFVEADAASYSYPQNLDVIFAFASLLHVSKQELPMVFTKGLAALKESGIYYISLKERPEYVEEPKIDQYGERMFYYYSPAIIQKLAGDGFQKVYESHQTIGHTNWFTLALQRCSS